MKYLTLTVSIVVLVFAGNVEADVNVVPGSGTPIQDAIDAASPGETINVAAGTYGENLTISKNVSILGAFQGVNPAGSISRGTESMITGQVEFTAAGNGATLNGFQLSGNRIWVHGADNITASYNILTDSGSHGIYIDGSSSNAQVLYNTVSSPAYQGISNQGNSGVTISHNYITGVDTQQPIESTSHTGTGIQITHNVISDSTNAKGINYWGGSGAVISFNEISGTTYEGIYNDGKSDVTISHNQIEDSGHHAIVSANHTGTGIEITHNVISNSDAKAINYWGDVGPVINFNVISGTGGASEGIFSDTKTNTIEGNIISNTGGPGIQLYPVSVANEAERSVISGNTITATKYQGITVFGQAYTEITGNTLTGCNYFGADGTGDWDYAGIHVEDLWGQTSAYSVIQGNTISDGINGIQTWSDNVSITNNEIYDMGVTYADTKVDGGRTFKNSAILVGSNWASGNPDQSDPSGVTSQYNDIYDNYWGLSHSDEMTNGVDAEYNWWGGPGGPGVGGVNGVGGNVDYTPWTSAQIPDVDGGSATITVTDDWSGYGTSGLPAGGGLVGERITLEDLVLDDTFVTLKAYYDPSAVGAEDVLRLYWYDASASQWFLAGRNSNNNNASGADQGVSSPTGVLGDWGVNTAGDYVWANIDHASDYGVATPVPGSVLMAAMGLGMVGWLKRRKKEA